MLIQAAKLLVPRTSVAEQKMIIAKLFLKGWNLLIHPKARLAMNKYGISNIRYVILAVSVLFISIGVMRKEQVIVLKKAINICLECIGIG